MQLLKPGWVNHDVDKVIYSVDIHPDGSRFATGGQGQDSSGRVVIWNLAPVVSEKAEKDEKVHKLLCQLDQHLGCVNCVRWSHSGRFLASAGDDKAIIIWQQSSYGGGTVFGSNVVNVESWRIVSTLRGHNGDILDVAWSPGDVWLASASVDNTVIIWNAEKWPEQTRVLKGHTGLVKGVAWDPIGRYVASQADDKSMRVWKTSTWTTEHKITEPFVECGGTTSILRPSWSPDGQYLVSAHAMNNGGPTAQIIERDGWNTDKDFVGHRKAVTCVRFNPNIFKKFTKSSKKNDGSVVKPIQYCCVAIGSRDRALSIWFTSLKRPLVVIHELFEDSILDLSWSSCGRYLMAVSKDGSLAFLQFPQKDIGIPLTKDETNATHIKLYGNSAINSTASVTTTIIENPELLRVQNEEKAQKKSVDKKVNSSSKQSMPNGPINKQIEVRTADGRRRITPMFIPPTSEGDQSQSSQVSFSTSRQEKSKIVVEKLDGVVQPNVTTSPNKSPTKDGAPVPISSTVEASFDPNSSSMMTKIEISSSKKVGTENHEENKTNLNASVTPTSLMDKPALTIAVKRKADDAGNISQQIAKKKRGKGRPPIFERSENTSPASRPTSPISAVAPAVNHQVPLTTAAGGEGRNYSRHFLAPSVLPRVSKVQIPGFPTHTEGCASVICIENEWKVCFEKVTVSRQPTLNRVSRQDGGKEVWNLYIPSQISAYVCSKDFTTFACADNSLHIVNNVGGSYLLPPLLLTGMVSLLQFHKCYLIVVTTDAALIIWDLEKRKKVFKDTIVHLVENRVSNGYSAIVKSVQVITSGEEKCQPVVVLHSGEAFTWHEDIESWLQIGEGCDLRRYISSEYAVLPFTSNPTDVDKSEGLTEILRQSSTYSGSHRFVNSLAISHDVKQGLTEGFLRRMMSSADLLKSKADYILWFKKLVKFYISEGFEDLLRKIFESMLRPQPSKRFWWDPNIVTLDREKLLEEFLRELLVAENSIKFQRMHAEYAEQLKGMDVDSI